MNVRNGGLQRSMDGGGWMSTLGSSQQAGTLISIVSIVSIVSSGSS
jgi:hypothetical protein